MEGSEIMVEMLVETTQENLKETVKYIRSTGRSRSPCRAASCRGASTCTNTAAACWQTSATGRRELGRAALSCRGRLRHATKAGQSSRETRRSN